MQFSQALADLRAVIATEYVGRRHALKAVAASDHRTGSSFVEEPITQIGCIACVHADPRSTTGAARLCIVPTLIWMVSPHKISIAESRRISFAETSRSMNGTAAARGVRMTPVGHIKVNSEDTVSNRLCSAS